MCPSYCSARRYADLVNRLDCTVTTFAGSVEKWIWDSGFVFGGGRVLGLVTFPCDLAAPVSLRETGHRSKPRKASSQVRPEEPALKGCSREREGEQASTSVEAIAVCFLRLCAMSSSIAATAAAAPSPRTARPPGTPPSPPPGGGGGDNDDDEDRCSAPPDRHEGGPPPRLTDLPHELQRKVASFLQLEEVVGLSSTCRSVRVNKAACLPACLPACLFCFVLQGVCCDLSANGGRLSVHDASGSSFLFPTLLFRIFLLRRISRESIQ
jgi:hypothetical protein